MAKSQTWNQFLIKEKNYKCLFDKVTALFKIGCQVIRCYTTKKEEKLIWRKHYLK